MAALKASLRLFSFLFHALLTLFLAAASGLALATGTALHLGMLPWTGQTLAYVVFFGSLTGLLTAILAVWRKWRALFLVWCLTVAVLAVKGYVFSGYHYFSGAEVRLSLALMAGSLVAVLGAWFQLWSRREGPRRYSSS